MSPFGARLEQFFPGTGSPTSSSCDSFPGIAPMLGTGTPASNDLPKLMILYVVISLCHLLFGENKAFSFFSPMKHLCVSNVFSCPRALVSHLSSLVFSSLSAEKGGNGTEFSTWSQVCADSLDNSVTGFSVFSSDLLFLLSIILILPCFQWRFAWGSWHDCWSYHLLLREFSPLIKSRRISDPSFLHGMFWICQQGFSCSDVPFCLARWLRNSQDFAICN